MVENIITIPKNKLQKGTITENGTYEDNNAHIRTTSVSNYAVPNDTAFLRCELDCEAVQLSSGRELDIKIYLAVGVICGVIPA